MAATAPGKKSWSQEIEANRPGATVEVNVPLLEDEVAAAPVASATASASAAAPPPPPATPAAPGKRQRTAGLIVGGAGLVGMGLGAYIGLAAKKHYDTSDPYCSGDKCLQEGADIRKEGIARANLATLVVGVGAAALVAGVIVYATAPRAQTPSTAWVVGPGSVSLQGTW